MLPSVAIRIEVCATSVLCLSTEQHTHTYREKSVGVGVVVDDDGDDGDNDDPCRIITTDHRHHTVVVVVTPTWLVCSSVNGQPTRQTDGHTDRRIQMYYSWLLHCRGLSPTHR